MEDMEVQGYNPDDWIYPKTPRACYYVTHKITNEQVLIPMCWGTVHSKDIEDCHCEHKKEPTKQELKQEINSLKQRVEELEEELKYIKTSHL